MESDLLRITLTATAGILMVGGSIPYIVNILRQRTRPNVVSWSGWTFLSAIAAMAQFAKGPSLSLAVPVGSTIGTGIVALLGIRYGYTKFNTIEKICFSLGVVAIVIWILTKEPLTAIIISIIADIIFLLPTSIKSFREPDTETATTFVLFVAGSALGLIASRDLSLHNILFPMYLIGAYGSTTLILLIRRRMLNKYAA